MEIEAGDYFAVVRGFGYHKVDFSSIFSGPQYDYMGNGDKKEEKPQYDRSHDGNIYLAREVCGSMIAAFCMYSSDLRSIGKMLSINTRELEIWPISKRYVESLGINTTKVESILNETVNKVKNG